MKMTMNQKGFVLTAIAAVLLFPGLSQAQVSCTSGTAVTGDATNTVSIAGGTNNPGISCVYTGIAGTVATQAATSVSTTAGGTGINLTGGATDAIRWNSTAGNITGGAQTGGPVIDAQAGGDIVITTAGVSVNASGNDGIFARSTNAGDVSMTATSVGFGNAAGSTAIEAISNGGNIAVTTTGGQVGTNVFGLANATANHDGVVATTSGAGNIVMTLVNPSVGSGGSGFAALGFGAGGAAVRATNDSGDVTINVRGEISGGTRFNANSAQVAAGIVVDSGGDVVIDSQYLIMGAINAAGTRPAAITASGDTFLLTMTGNPQTGAADFGNYRAALGGFFTSQGFYTSAVGAISGQMPDVAARHLGGHVDLSGVTQGAQLSFNTRSRWMLEGTSLLSPGNDSVSIDDMSVLMTTFHFPKDGTPTQDDVDQLIIRPGIIEFGGGEDVFNNAGQMLIGPAYSQEAGVGTGPDLPPFPEIRYGIRGEVRMMDLERFNNSGTIWLGPMIFGRVAVTRTDGWRDDMLYMPGTHFHGEEGSSVVYMDIDLASTQSSCAPSTRNELGYLPAADCIGLQGGGASGRTELRVVELVPGDRGAYNPDGTVLVDLAGGDIGDIDPEAFFLSPDTPNYVDVANGGIEKGVFLYAFGFDPDSQQFKLYGLPSEGAQQFPILATAANQLWRTANGGWFDRRVRQREVERDAGLGTGTWINVTDTGASRDLEATTLAGGTALNFDNSYNQDDTAVSFGWDLINHRNEGGVWNIGAMVGYARSQVTFDAVPNDANLEGMQAGIYGGWSAGGFFVDAALTAMWASLHNDVPAMNLTPSGTQLDTDLTAMGGRVEAGWRWNSGSFFVEPLLGLSMVQSEFDDLRVPNDDPDPNRPAVTFKLDAADSTRASIGARFGVDRLWSATLPTSLSLTARAVNEMEGEAQVSVLNLGPTALVEDKFDGTFTQLTGSIGVTNAKKTIEGYLNLDSTFNGDYSSFGGSLGIRLQW